MSPQTSEDVTKVMLPKPFFCSCVNKKESTHRKAEGMLGCRRRACGESLTSVSSSRVAFLSVHAVENMTVKTSETRHPENTQ